MSERAHAQAHAQTYQNHITHTQTHKPLLFKDQLQSGRNFGSEIYNILFIAGISNSKSHLEAL